MNYILELFVAKFFWGVEKSSDALRSIPWELAFTVSIALIILLFINGIRKGEAVVSLNGYVFYLFGAPLIILSIGWSLCGLVGWATIPTKGLWYVGLIGFALIGIQCLIIKAKEKTAA